MTTNPNTTADQRELERQATAGYTCPVCQQPRGERCTRKRSSANTTDAVVLQHPHPERVELVRKDLLAESVAAGQDSAAEGSQDSAAGQDSQPEGGQPVHEADSADQMRALVADMAEHGKQVSELLVPVADKDTAKQAFIAARTGLGDAGKKWTIGGANVREGTGKDRKITAIRFTIKAPKPAAASRRGSSGSGGSSRATGEFTECKNCKYQYAHAWTQDHCNSERACNRRKAITAMQRKLKLPVTVWNVHGHDLGRLAREAEAAIKTAQDAAAARQADLADERKLAAAVKKEARALKKAGVPDEHLDSVAAAVVKGETTREDAIANFADKELAGATAG